MEKLRSNIFGSFSAMKAAAFFSVLVLVGVGVYRVYDFLRPDADPATFTVNTETSSETPGADWQQEMILLGLATSSDPSATSDTDPISMIGPQVFAQLLGQYAGLTENGTYTEASGAAAAEQIAGNVKAAISYKTYTNAEIKTDQDTSYARMLTYRSDLRDAFAPLLEITEPEFSIYARYVETSDADELLKLREAAAQYREAIQLTAAVTVPKDAINYHRAVLNAMSKFAATLDSLATHADDPLGSVALLRTYNEAEEGMFMSFDALGGYYSQKRL